jgi:O-antigen/teichoic acid export membrane protein
MGDFSFKTPKSHFISSDYVHILKGAFFSSLNTIVVALVALIMASIAVRTLPKELSGVYFLYLNFSALIMLADIGLSPTLSREIAFTIGRSSDADSQNRIALLYGCILRLLLISALIVLVSSMIIGTFYFNHVVSETHRSVAVYSWIVYAIGSAINLYSASGFAGLYGLGHVSLERSGRIASVLFGLAFNCVFIWIGLGLLGLSLAWVAQGIAGYVIGWYLLLKKQPHLKNTLTNFDKKIAIKILSDSYKLAITTIGGVLMFNATNFFIGFYLGPQNVSDFSVIARMATFAQAIGMAVALSSAPHISREYAVHNMTAIRQILKRNLIIGMASVFVPLLVITFFAPQILEIWLGNGHFAGYGVLLPYLIMVLLETHNVIHASAVMATGNLPFAPWAISSGILTVIFCIFLIPTFSLMGASLSIMFAQLLTNNWYVPYFSFMTFFKKSKESYL